MLLAKEIKKSPTAVARSILDHWDASALPWLKETDTAGAGFINFTLDPMCFHGVLAEALTQDQDFGHSDYGQGEKIQVEFVSANPTGDLHMGNARGAALGDSLANVLAAAGWSVSREYYINDAGNQIENFGKSLEARYLQAFGQDVQVPEEGYHGEDLVGTVQRIIDREKDRYLSMDSKLRKEFLIQAALKEKLETIRGNLADFGVRYDTWFSEQTLHDNGEIQETLDELDKKGLLERRDGAVWLLTTRMGDEKDEVVVRANGIPTYFAADIAYHRNKFRRGFRTAINIWGADHHGHVARMKQAMGACGYDPDQLEVLLIQLVRLYSQGQLVRMSKRTGQYVTLSELMEDVGKDAARFFFIMRNPDSHLDFDMDLAKEESNENPVYYVQYAHARIHSLMKLGRADIPMNPGSIDFSLLRDPHELELIRKIAEFTEEVTDAAIHREPHRLTRYVLDLAGLFHSFYNAVRVLHEDPALKDARLALADATRITLRNALAMLGVSAPERM
jgi:arginyl-tRNA synthetase